MDALHPLPPRPFSSAETTMTRVELHRVDHHPSLFIATSDPEAFRDVLHSHLKQYLEAIVKENTAHVDRLDTGDKVNLNFHFSLDVSVPFSVKTLDERSAVRSFRRFISDQRVIARGEQAEKIELLTDGDASNDASNDEDDDEVEEKERTSHKKSDCVLS